MIFKVFLLLLLPSLAQAKLNVVTTTTDIKWLVEKIGGERVVVESLLSGFEDPHYIDAMPHFVGKAARADVFCLVGLDLEVGWVPKVLSRSANKNVQPGGKGYCDVGKGVSALGIPQGKIDRSQGDVHPGGNPHYHLGPDAFLDGGKIVLGVLMGLDAPHADLYRANFQALKGEMAQLKKRIAAIVAPLKGKRFMEYHENFAYFFHEFGLNTDGAMEELPGVPPSAGRLARVIKRAKERGVTLMLVTDSASPGAVRKFRQSSGIPVLNLPVSILSKGEPGDYPALLVSMAKKMVDSAK